MLDHVEDISLIELFAASRTPQLRSAMMESLSDRYMRQIRLSLFERIRNPVQIIASTNTIEALDTTLSRLPEMILAAIVQAEPVNARILVVIEGALIGAVVDSMCGATRADQFKREELSAMELRIGKQLIELTLTTMMDVWGAHTPLNLGDLPLHGSRTARRPHCPTCAAERPAHGGPAMGGRAGPALRNRDGGTAR